MARRRKKKSYACRRGVITFHTKRGKVVHFPGKHGKGCGPRKKPTTRHLARYKRAMSAAARACKGKSIGPFRACVRQRMKHA